MGASASGGRERRELRPAWAFFGAAAGGRIDLIGRKERRSEAGPEIHQIDGAGGSALGPAEGQFAPAALELLPVLQTIAAHAARLEERGQGEIEARVIQVVDLGRIDLAQGREALADFLEQQGLIQALAHGVRGEAVDLRLRIHEARDLLQRAVHAKVDHSVLAREQGAHQPLGLQHVAEARKLDDEILGQTPLPEPEQGMRAT